MQDEIEQEDIIAYDLFIAALAIAAVVLISFRLFLADESETAQLIDYLDIGVCIIFFIDFCRSLIVAKNRWRYMYTWGWFDLLSSIPAIAGFRYFRIARIFRILRVVRSIRILVQVARRDRPAAILSLLFLGGILGFMGICIGVLQVEQDAPGSTLRNAEDVIWFSVVTSSTVGYGHVYPVTNEGRMLASFLMVIGIGAFATTTTALGVMFRRVQTKYGDVRHAEHERTHMDSIDERLERIEKLLNDQRRTDEES